MSDELPPSPVVELQHPVSAADLLPSLEANGRLNCCGTLAAADCRVVDAFLADHPQVCLRVYQPLDSREPPDLQFLAAIPSLRDAWLCADAGSLVDLAPLANLPRELRALMVDTLQRFSDKKLDKPKTSTAQLSRFTELAELCLCGRLKDLDFLATMASLRSLRLWRSRLQSLAGIGGAVGLSHLELKACGASDLAPLAGLPELRSLEVWDQRNLKSLDALARLPKLERMWLISGGRDFVLPSLGGFRALRVLVLHAMARHADIPAIADAPELQCLVLSHSPQPWSVEALRPLAGHPTLKEVRIEDARAGASIAEAYGWKVVYPNFPADEYLTG